MLFPTIRFALFFLVVLPASWLLMAWRQAWRVFIVAASFVFYGSWDWRFVALLAGSIVGNQLLARAIDGALTEGARRAWLMAGVAANLAVLGW